MQSRCDALTLYAWLDKAHKPDRESWRKFFALLLPLLLDVGEIDLESLFDESSFHSVEEAIQAQNDDAFTIGSVIRNVSIYVASCLGVVPELAFAVFIDCSVPTKAHATRLKAAHLSEHSLMTRWLQRFTRIQDDDEFLEHIANYKRNFDELKHMELEMREQKSA